MSTNARLTIGRLLATLGGAACTLGYFLPWVTYHPNIEGTIGNRPFSGWSNAWSGAQWGTGGIAPETIAGLILAGVLLLPLVAGILALVAGARGRIGVRWPVSPRLYWTIIALGLLSLLFTTYSLDPFGWSSDATWVVFREAPPTIEIALYMMYAGMLAVLAGGLLLFRGRQQRMAATPTPLTQRQ